MKKNNKINFFSALIISVIVCLIFTSSSIFAQEMKDMPMHNIKNMKHNKSVKVDSTFINKGVIHLSVIDKNKDGKVFQDQMDWNVISDKPGKCPLCNMSLKEVTLKQAQVNLKKHGFSVKQ